MWNPDWDEQQIFEALTVIHSMEEKEQDMDNTTEQRTMAIVKFAGFFIVLMVIWYGLNLAENL